MTDRHKPWNDMSAEERERWLEHCRKLDGWPAHWTREEEERWIRYCERISYWPTEENSDASRVGLRNPDELNELFREELLEGWEEET